MDTINGVMWVALGSVLGGTARFWLSGFVARRVGETFPWGTMVVNVSGAFLLGILAASAASHGIFAGRETVAIRGDRHSWNLHNRIILQPSNSGARPRRRNDRVRRGIWCSRFLFAFLPSLAALPPASTLSGKGQVGKCRTTPHQVRRRAVRSKTIHCLASTPSPRWQTFWDKRGSYISVALGSIVGAVARFLVSVSVREPVWRRISLGHIVRQRDGFVRYRVLCGADRPRRQVVRQPAAKAVRHGRHLRRLHDVFLVQSRDLAICAVRQSRDGIRLSVGLGHYVDSRSCG